jgi:hypothetical protein
MAYAPPRTDVSPPARVGLPFGLFSVLSFPPPGDEHWQNGAEWTSVTCSPAVGFGDPDCEVQDGVSGLPLVFRTEPEEEGGVGENQFGPSFGAADPFTIVGQFLCSPVGFSPEQASQAALSHLLSREEYRVEQALWTGDLFNGTQQGFAQGAVDLTPAAGVLTPQEGIALLEDWLARSYGSLGVIHLTRSTATIAITQGAVVASGGQLKTVLGTPVVAGSGYPGTSPDGMTPDDLTNWGYATGAMTGMRSEPIETSNRFGDRFDRGRNELSGLAERTYVIGWDSCPGTAGVLMNLYGQTYPA